MPPPRYRVTLPTALAERVAESVRAHHPWPVELVGYGDTRELRVEIDIPNTVSLPSAALADAVLALNELVEFERLRDPLTDREPGTTLGGMREL